MTDQNQSDSYRLFYARLTGISKCTSEKFLSIGNTVNTQIMASVRNLIHNQITLQHWPVCDILHFYKC